MRRGSIGPVAALLMGCAGAVHAADDGGTQSPFVLGVGARSLAMGRTAVAWTQDATALFWNPARLSAATHAEFTLFRTTLFDDGTAYHAGFAAYPTLDAGTIAIGYQRLDVSGIERRDDRNALLGSFEAGEANLLLGYGRNIGASIAIGGALRIVQQGVDDATAVGVGCDLGVALGRSFGPREVHRWGLGANIVNALEPKLRIVDASVPDPRTLKLGAAYSLRPTTGSLSWTVAADVDLPTGIAPRVGVGAEVAYRNLFALRSGLDAGHLTFGIGISWRRVRFDYAMRADDELSRSDRFTVGLQLGEFLAVRREARQLAREHEVSERLALQLAEQEVAEHARAVAEARQSFEARKFEDAARLYRRVLTLSPDDAEARERVEAAELELALEAAAKLLTDGAAAQAAAAYLAVEVRWPGDARGRSGLAEARQRLQRATDLDRQLAELFKNALTSFTEGNFAATDIALEELLRLQPAHELGLALRQRVREAHARGRKSYDKARALAASGNYAEALTELASAQVLLGSSPDMRKLGETWTAARASGRQLPVVEGTSPPLPPVVMRRRTLSATARRELDDQYEEGFTAFRAGDFERAIRNWRSVWTQDPAYKSVGDNLIKAYLYEGIALYGSGEYAQALERCQRVLDIDPQNEKALRYQRRIQEEKSELEHIKGKTP